MKTGHPENLDCVGGAPVVRCVDAEAIEPYLVALQRYSDGWFNLAIDYGMKASVAASHAKHMQDAINGIRGLYSENQ